MEPNKKRRYITGFDGLRTIGVLGVILYHLRPDVFQGGYLGVPIFMTVSGYLITDGLLREYSIKGKIDFKSFFVRRIKRLYPGLIAMLFATSAYITLFATNLLHNLHMMVITNLTYVFNWWQIVNGQSYFARFADGESPFTHLWTLSIEGQFYLIWPIIVLLLIKLVKPRSRAFNIVFILAVISAAWMAVLYQPHGGQPFDPSRLYYGTDTRAFGILLGSALAFVWPSSKLARNISRRDRFVLNAVGTLSMLGMLAMVMFTTDESAFLYRGGMFLFSVLVTLLLAVIAHPGVKFNELLSNPVFSWIGQRSYGIYLYQFPVMIFFEGQLKDVADHQILYPVLEVIIILALTEISFRLIEKPMAKFDYSRIGSFFKKGLWRPRNLSVSVVALVILGVGMRGLIEAPTIKTDAADHSELAERLKDTKADKEAKKKRLAKMKASISESRKKAKEDSAKQSTTTSTSSSTSVKPVNQEFEKYGMNQAELQKAQTVGITAVGDSVMKDGEPILQKIFPQSYIDADVSRQAFTGVDILKKYASQGALADVVLVGLGTNGTVSPDQVDDVMKTVGDSTEVFWINVRVPTRSWQNDVNATLAAADKKYDNLHVLDWYHYSNEHEDWFYKDRVHPNPTGNPYYGAFVAKEILKTVMAAKNK